jgi:hypothetical protein
MRLSLRFLSATLLFAFLSSFLTPSSACTVGVFGPSATTDGRPILWKNRDVDNDNQEVAFRQGPRFAYVTNVYGSEDTIGAWAGINAAGFAIMNSNSYNLSGLTDAADDGDIMALALGTCATVDELKAILDSTNVVGRTQPANFGCFDSTGRTVFFEASNTFYTIYEASADPYGYLLRANYSMSGDSVRLRGKNRYDRAMQVTLPEWQRSGISVPFLVSVLCRDMGQVGFDPYPSPLPACRSASSPAIRQSAAARPAQPNLSSARVRANPPATA